MRVHIITVALIFLSACASEVTSIKQDHDILKEPNKGYLLLGIETNRDLKNIFISGKSRIKLTSADIKKGTNYLLIDLEAGEYVIEKVLLDSYWRVEFEEESYWSFEVKPNQISYVGHLEIVRRGFWNHYTNAELVNRSSEALEFLEANYPNVLSSRGIAYGGPGEDKFFQLITAQSKE